MAKPALLILLFLIFMAICIRNPKRGFWWAIFLLPWFGLQMDVGIGIAPYEIMILSLLITFAYRNRLFLCRRGLISHALIAFIFYIVMWSLIQIPLLPESVEVIKGGILRDSLRPFAQITVLLLITSPIIISPHCITKTEDIRKAGEIYVLSAVVLAIIGWFQIVIWYVTGHNPLPMGLLNSSFSEQAIGTYSGYMRYMGVPIYRMNSFGGEPKGLGQSLVIAMLLVQVVLKDMRHSRRDRRKLGCIWAFLAASVLATMSTSAFYLWILGTVTYRLGKVAFGLQRPLRPSFLSIAGLCLLLFCLIAIAQSNLVKKTDDSLASSLLHDRTLGRGFIDDFDGLVLTYLRHDPGRIVAGVGLGNAHLYAAPYSREAMRTFGFVRKKAKFGTVFVAKSGYLRLVSEAGLVGLGLLFLGVWWHVGMVMRRSKEALGRQEQELLRVMSLFTLGVFICYLARGYVTYQFWATLSVCIAGRKVSGISEEALGR